MISNSGHDENGRYSNGKAGDQLGDEWAVIKWYSRPWNYILRHPDHKVRAEIARLAKASAYNNNIGYDQGERTSFWRELSKVGYEPSKITVKCESDCSCGVLSIVKAVGYILNIQALKNVDYNGYTGNERKLLSNAGFEVLTASKYLTSDNYLLEGDVLLYENHHTAINLDDGCKVTDVPTSTVSTKSNEGITVVNGSAKSVPADYFETSLGGTYKVTASTLNMRTGASTNKTVIAKLENGVKVKCYGYYDKDISGTKWYYVVAGIYTGYVSSKYLVKA